MNRILNFGSLNIDHVYQVDHFVAPGETASSLSYALFPGGKGLNQSVALARAGAQVFHAGKIGRDGTFLSTLLEQDGVDTRFLSTDGSVTGHAVIQVNAQGQNCILLHGGSNLEITQEEISHTLSAFGPGDLLVLQNEVNRIASLMELAAAQGMEIAFNPSPLDGRIASYPLEKVTWLLLNEVEGAALTGRSQPEEIAQVLLKRYPSIRIVLTLGGEGSLYLDAMSHHTAPAYPVQTLDTTAAGDTFTGYFLSAAQAGLPIPNCLARAARAAALAVSRQGAAVSIPYRQEVDG